MPYPTRRQAVAGGVAFKLPFGTLYSTNITADRETGIGQWSDDDFVRALHRGVAKDGRNLYPAFPYTSYIAVTRDDAVAIKAYLFSADCVRTRRAEPIGVSFNQRWTLTFWKWIFLDGHRFRLTRRAVTRRIAEPIFRPRSGIVVSAIRPEIS